MSRRRSTNRYGQDVLPVAQQLERLRYGAFTIRFRSVLKCSIFRFEMLFCVTFSLLFQGSNSVVFYLFDGMSNLFSFWQRIRLFFVLFADHAPLIDPLWNPSVVWVSLCLYCARSILLFACISTSSIKMILFLHWLLFFARWSRDVVVCSEETRDPQADGAAAGSHQRWWLWNLRVS